MGRSGTQPLVTVGEKIGIGVCAWLSAAKAAHSAAPANVGVFNLRNDQVADKATVTVRCNHADPNGGPRRRFQVAGTKGAMEILPLESGRATLWLDEAHEPWKKGVQSVSFPAGKGRYDGEFIELARVIRSGGRERLRWDAAHDVAVHGTVLRVAGVWKGESS